MKVITINNWRRPFLYKGLLESLERCDGIKDYKIINIIDKSTFSPAIAKIDKENKLASQIETVSLDTNVGCAKAKHIAFTEGFKHSDFVINLEDDMVVGKDFLEYMEWGAETYKDDPEIFLITAWNRRKEAISDDLMKDELDLVSRRETPSKEHLTYQGFGIWRHIWDEIKDDWFGIHWADGWKPEPKVVAEGEDFLKQIDKADDGSWGWPMKQYWRRGRKEIYPIVSRVQNVGSVLGKFNWSVDWHMNHVYTQVYSHTMTADNFQELL